MKADAIVVVWDRDGKYFQTWTVGAKPYGDVVEHGKTVAKNIGGTYFVFDEKSDDFVETTGYAAVDLEGNIKMYTFSEDVEKCERSCVSQMGATNWYKFKDDGWKVRPVKVETVD